MKTEQTLESISNYLSTRFGGGSPVALTSRNGRKKQPERRPWGETALGDHFALGASRRRTRSRGGAFSLTLSTLALRALALLGTLGV